MKNRTRIRSTPRPGPFSIFACFSFGGEGGRGGSTGTETARGAALSGVRSFLSPFPLSSCELRIMLEKRRYILQLCKPFRRRFSSSVCVVCPAVTPQRQVDTDRLEARLHGPRVLVPEGPARVELRRGHRGVEHGRGVTLREGGLFVRSFLFCSFSVVFLLYCFVKQDLFCFSR